MAVNYPGSIDAFNEPTLPEATPLSEAGTATRNHVEHHHDLGQAVVQLETNAAQLTHIHDGSDGPFGTPKLLQANTHQTPDTDSATTALHHTIDPTGASSLKAAAANHVHNYNGSTITNKPYFLCTTTTRPGSPTIGTMIYESDTNTVRVWAQFPGQSSPIWQLLPNASVPILRAETHQRQQIAVGSPTTCFFDTVLEDLWGFLTFFVPHFVETSITANTDVVISEPGHYHVHATICWDPSFTFGDHTLISTTVNGVDIGRKNWEFVRGFDFTPGFSQTNEIYFMWYFNEGDVLRVIAQHNASEFCWLWFEDTSPNKQVCTLDVAFHGP